MNIPSRSNTSGSSNLYNQYTLNATLPDFRQNQAQYIVAAQIGPVELRSCGAQTRTALVSPAFYEETMETLEERHDRRARDELDHWLREGLVQTIRDYEGNPGDVRMPNEIRAELGLR